MKKGQTSIEFVTLMTFMMVIFIIVFVVIQQKSYSVKDAQTQVHIQGLANVVINEIELAYAVHDGYKKYFWIPEYINGEEFTINIIDHAEIVIDYKNKQFITFLGENRTNVSGQIIKGDNTIIKNSSGIYIEPGQV